MKRKVTNTFSLLAFFSPFWTLVSLNYVLRQYKARDFVLPYTDIVSTLKNDFNKIKC